MKSLICIFGALSLATLASATTCPTATWCFGSNPEQVGNGATYSSNLGTISVYGEQVTNSSTGGTFYSSSDSSIGGLFSTNDSDYDEGVGIAPYNPAEGTSWGTFSSQDGITDQANGNSKYGNILVLELGSNIAQGTTLSFLLQAGVGASGDAVTAYYMDATGSSPSTSMSPSSMTKFVTTTDGQISTNGMTPQFSLTKNTSGIEFVAIEADCHYLLLDTITGRAAATPEPRFYGLMLAGLLGIAGMFYQKRRNAEVNA